MRSRQTLEGRAAVASAMFSSILLQSSIAHAATTERGAPPETEYTATTERGPPIAGVPAVPLTCWGRVRPWRDALRRVRNVFLDTRSIINSPCGHDRAWRSTRDRVHGHDRAWRSTRDRVHAHDRAWPSMFGGWRSRHLWRDALRSRPPALDARPRRSVALHIGARWAATTERGPPYRRTLGGHDRAWPSKTGRHR